MGEWRGDGAGGTSCRADEEWEPGTDPLAVVDIVVAKESDEVSFLVWCRQCRLRSRSPQAGWQWTGGVRVQEREIGGTGKMSRLCRIHSPLILAEKKRPRTRANIAVDTTLPRSSCVAIAQ
jgi:hypothetical protein